MPPKQKALDDISNNISNRTDSSANQQSSNHPKKQRLQGKQNVPSEAVDGNAAPPTPSPPVVKKKPIKQRADARSLPGLPEFEPFHSPFPEHNAKVDMRGNLSQHTVKVGIHILLPFSFTVGFCRLII